jgi:uncharacterized protein (DUF58 family)
MPLLSNEFLHRLDTLRLAANQPARGHLRGLHRSNRRGTGMEFADYRAYSEGDDLKNVDWPTYLRLDRLIVKLFVEEADLPIYLFLDASASMGVGEPSKFDYGRKVAAALAHLGFINMDRVSVAAISDGALREMSGLRGKDQSWPVFKFLEQIEARGKTSLETALKRYFGVPKAKGLSVLISDFLDADFESALRVLRNVHQEVLALHVVSPQELEPALTEELLLVDAEDGTSVEHQITPAALDAYKRAFAEHCDAIKSFCDRNAWVYVRAATDGNIEDLVLRALRKEGLLK